MTNDPTLETIVKGSLGDIPTQLTLLISGQAIVGTFVTATVYRDGSGLGPTSFPAADNAYIHLRDAWIASPNPGQKIGLGWFRCRIDAVQGYAIAQQPA